MQQEVYGSCAEHPSSDSLHYARVVILDQSYSRSTLFNDLFGTCLKALDEDDDRQKTTKGLTAGFIPGAGSYPTILLLYCKGSESKERATENDRNIERCIGAFASAIADILIVHILQTDVSRVEGFCANLLKSIFSVYFQLRNNVKMYITNFKQLLHFLCESTSAHTIFPGNCVFS